MSWPPRNSLRQAGLKANARALLQSRGTPLAFSLATIWAAASRTSLGRPDFAVDPAALQQGLVAEGFIEWPIGAPHSARVATLPWVHRDPFDRLLVAQAMVDQRTLPTAGATPGRRGRFVKPVGTGTSAPAQPRNPRPSAASRSSSGDSVKPGPMRSP